jgi:transposase
MEATYYSGIDLHKRSSHITTVRADGSLVKEANLKNHASLITAYFAGLPGSHQAVVESTPNWYWLIDLLHNQGIDIRLAHAKYVKAISYAKVKTDKVDAHTLAQLLRMDMIPAAHQVNPERRAHRDILRTRLKLVHRKTMATNAIHLLCAKFNVKDILDLPPAYQLQAGSHLRQVELLDQEITMLEEALYPELVPDADIQRLIRIPRVKASFFRIAGWSPRLKTPVGARVSRRAKMETATSSWLSRTLPCERSSSTAKSRTSTAAKSVRSPKPSRGRWSPRNWLASFIMC